MHDTQGQIQVGKSRLANLVKQHKLECIVALFLPVDVICTWFSIVTMLRLIAGASCEFSGPRVFAAGDVVKVELDPDVLKLLQEGHGGWNDLMFEVKMYYKFQVSIDHHLDSVMTTKK